MDDSIKGENEALIDALEKYMQPEVVAVDPTGNNDAAVLVVPRGMTVQSVKGYLDEYRDAPARITGTARLTTLQSFCDHVMRFRSDHTALFADDDVKAPELVAVLDYSERGAPRFGQHRASYYFPVSDEWRIWTGATNPMSQEQFARFVEDRIQDVIDPKSAGEMTWAFAEQLEIALSAPSALMTLAKGLTVYVDARATHTVNLSSGEGQLSFAEEHKDAAGAPLKVPKGFAVGIPVFAGGERYQLPVRLRYKVQGGKVSWTLVPYRTEVVFRHAFTTACAKAAEDTKLPLFYGRPEE